MTRLKRSGEEGSGRVIVVGEGRGVRDERFRRAIVGRRERFASADPDRGEH